MNVVTNSAAHPFDQALALAPVPASDLEPGRNAARLWRGNVDSTYMNMVGPFGGITAAQMLYSVLQHPDLQGEPLSLTVNFAAALALGPFQSEVRPVRTNRSTQHWTVVLTQTDAEGTTSVTTTATVITAKRRSTWSATDAVMPDVPPPQSLPETVVERPLPWRERYDIRVCAGGLPREWNGAESDSLTELWVRDAPARTLDFCSLAALCDAFYPRIWRRRARLTPAGTVSMTVYFHASAAELEAVGTGYVLGKATAQRFYDNFFDQRAELWSETGALVATSHQVAYFKD